jgi:hypothetical protein
MASTFNHNKKRNSALVYEFLVRHMGRTMIEKDLDAYRRTYEVARRYFGSGAYLAKELELFDVIRAARGLSERSARRVLEEVLSHASRLDRRTVEIKKSNLIKELNYSFGRDFFSRYRVPEYRLLASVQLLINATGAGTTLRERVENIVQLEESVVRYMMSTDPVAGPQAPDQVDRLVCALAAKKFQERYGDALNAPQKSLLERYVRSIVTGDQSRLTDHLESERRRISGVIDGPARSLREVKEDSVMRERLAEASSRLRELRTSEPDGSIVQEMMLYQKLVEELTNE